MISLEDSGWHPQFEEIERSLRGNFGAAPETIPTASAEPSER